jgi:hypothetical protein
MRQARDIARWRLEANAHELSMVLTDYQQNSAHLTALDEGIAEFEAAGEVEVDEGDTEDEGDDDDDDVEADEFEVDEDSDELEDEEVDGFV